jgi:hypothetical protein
MSDGDDVVDAFPVSAMGTVGPEIVQTRSTTVGFCAPAEATAPFALTNPPTR